MEEKERGESKRVNFKLWGKIESKVEVDRMKRKLQEQIERKVKKLEEDRKMYRETCTGRLGEDKGRRGIMDGENGKIEERLDALKKEIERLAVEKERIEKSERERKRD